MVEGAKDSGWIVNIFRDIGTFLQRFQVMLSEFYLGSVVTSLAQMDVALNTNALILQVTQIAARLVGTNLNLLERAT